MTKNIFLEEDYQTILRRINQLTPESQRQWGKMNVTQMLCHTADQLRLAMGFIEVKDQSNFISRNFTKWMALRMEAPKGKVETLEEINQVEGGGTPSVSFEDDKINLIKLLNAFKDKEDTYEWSPHPYFGKLSKEQWGRLAYMHLTHHSKCGDMKVSRLTQQKSIFFASNFKQNSEHCCL